MKQAVIKKQLSNDEVIFDAGRAISFHKLVNSDKILREEFDMNSGERYFSLVARRQQ